MRGSLSNWMSLGISLGLFLFILYVFFWLT